MIIVLSGIVVLLCCAGGVVWMCKKKSDEEEHDMNDTPSRIESDIELSSLETEKLNWQNEKTESPELGK